MKYLYSIFVLLCLFFSPNSFGQSSDKKTGQVSKDEFKNTKGLELYLQNTDFSILADNKAMKMLNRTEVNPDLSNAMLLRTYSRKLYESGNSKDALICNSKARQIAVKLLTDLKGADYAVHYNKFENEEQQLAEIAKDTSTVEEWLKEAKK